MENNLVIKSRPGSIEFGSDGSVTFSHQLAADFGEEHCDNRKCSVQRFRFDGDINSLCHSSLDASHNLGLNLVKPWTWLITTRLSQLFKRDLKALPKGHSEDS